MPTGTGPVIAMYSPSCCTCSNRTTASAPGGIGAPVMMRIAVPDMIAFCETYPAGNSAMTCNLTGLSTLASFVSLACIAYPSIAVFACGGMSYPAVTSRAKTRPSAERIGTDSASSGCRPVRTRSRASSTLSIGYIPVRSLSSTLLLLPIPLSSRWGRSPSVDRSRSATRRTPLVDASLTR